jgi:hypothetical protein
MLPKPPSAVDVISPAIHTTQHLMFRPFRFDRWWRVAVMAIFTGELGGTGGFNLALPDLRGLGRESDTSSRFMAGDNPFFQSDPATWIAIIVVLVVGLAILLLVHIYIGSVMRFVQFDAVARGRFRLREGWRTWHRHGLRWFGFHVLYLLIAMVVIGLVIAFFTGIGIGIYRADRAAAHFGAYLLLLLLALPILVVLLILAQVVWVLAKDFALPMVALEPLTVREALGRLRQVVMGAKGDFAIYILMKIALTIAAGVAVGVVSVILLLILAVPLVAGGVFAGIAWPDLLRDPVLLALLITAAIVLMMIFSFVLATLFSPVVIFFQAYVLHFLAPRYARLQPWMPQPPPIVPLGPRTA